jgi:hypothetical protein
MAAHKPTKGYNKHPLWQWVMLYMVVAFFVYGLLYYLFFRNGTSPNYSY